MDTQDLRTLKILEEIENAEAPSQRDLAGKLNISLGLVNSFIKRLAQKGYFKAATIPRNRVKYILTPKGAAEKARLTYEFVQYSFQFYKRARESTSRVFSGLDREGVKTAAFCGAGDLAEIAYVSLQETSIRLVCVLDDDCSRNRFLGVPVRRLSSLDPLSCDRFIVTTPAAPGKMKRALEEKGVAPDRICVLRIV